jgi:hypothetical protein
MPLLLLRFRENAILVVSSSLEKAQAQLRRLNVEYGPKIRQSGKCVRICHMSNWTTSSS